MKIKAISIHGILEDHAPIPGYLADEQREIAMKNM